jgi:hypothetical protein
MPKSISMALVIVALLLFTTGSSLYAQENRVILNCPATITNPAVDTPVPVEVLYTVGAVPVGGFSLGFHYDSDIIEVDSMSTIGSGVTQPLFFTPTVIDTDANTILVGWADFTAIMPLPAGDSALAFTLWFTVPGGTVDHCVDIDSMFVPPAGEFIFAASTGGSLTPTYVDCDLEDIVIGECGGPVGDPPVAVCQNVTVSADANCEAAIAAASVDAGSFDPDGTIESMVLVPAGPFTLGDTPVQLIVTDNDDRKDTCDAIITVEDNTNPVVTCPANITVGNDAGDCEAVVNFSATATDNCDGDVAITYSQNPGTAFPLGTTTVDVTATDDAGNQDFCSFTITVNDTEDPVAICPADIVVSNDPGECGAFVSFSIDVTDNCPGATVNSSHASGEIFDIGVTVVTVTATDAAGNTNACTFSITVNDTEDPVAICPADVVVTNDGSICGSNVVFSLNVSDNCPGATVSSVPASGDFFDVGITPVLVTATDVAGNQNTCSFNVQVDDTEDPTITCPADIFVQEEQGTNGAVVDFAATADDNCGLASLTYSQDPNTFFPVGLTTVTATAEDIHGNTAFCTFDITVIEINDPPVARDTSMTAPEDAATAAQLQAWDPEDDDLTYEVLAGPFNGTLPSFNTDTGAFQYLSNQDYNGPDSLKFVAHDLTNTSNEAWVFIDVTPTNDDPVARDTSITTTEDTPVNAQVHGYDIDGDDITFAIDIGPDHGTLTAFNTATGEFTYDPDGDYNGSDEFTFEVSDVTKFAITGTVSITVTPVNDAPTADDLAIETDEDTEVSNQVSGDDVDGDDIYFQIDQGPAHGTLTAWDEYTGDFTYMPDQDYNGDDQFTFVANDVDKDLSTPATVSITIHPVNDPPEASSKTYIVVKNTTSGLQLPGSDVDGDDLYWEIIDGPFEGSIDDFDFETGEFTYTPDLDVEDVLDSLEYGVTDEELEKGYVTSWVYIQIVPPAFFKFDPDSLLFEVNEYEPAPAPELVTIISEHPSGDDFLWNASEDADWLSLTPESDSTPSEVTFSVDHSGLLPGTYIAEVLFDVIFDEATGPQDTFMVYLIVHNPVSYDSVVVPTENAEPGEEVTIAIWARNSAPTREMRIPIRFDDDILTFSHANHIDTRWELAETYNYLNPIQPIIVLFADFRNIPFPPLARGAGLIAYLTFTVNEDVVPGSVGDIVLELAEDFYFKLDEDHGSADVTPVFSAGAITVDVTSAADDYDYVLPDEYSLAQNYPNPFNPETVIQYSLPKAGHVRLTVFNILGQSVSNLVSEYQSAGQKQVVWDGTDHLGNQVDSGVYFYRITSGEFDLTRKMVLMK